MLVLDGVVAPPCHLIAALGTSDRRLRGAQLINIYWDRRRPIMATASLDRCRDLRIRARLFTRLVAPWANGVQNLFPNFALKTLAITMDAALRDAEPMDIAAACAGLEQEVLAVVPPDVPRSVRLLVGPDFGQIYHNRDDAKSAQPADLHQHANIATDWFDRLGAWTLGVSVIAGDFIVQTLTAHEKIARRAAQGVAPGSELLPLSTARLPHRVRREISSL
jgi:hypothetical protein